MASTRISESDVERMAKLYERDLLPCSEIAIQFGCTRQRVYQLIRSRGVNTSDRKRIVQCKTCGKPVERTRKRARMTRNSYCSQECYIKQISSESYLSHRQGCRVGRAVIGQYVPLLYGYVLHHMDGNQDHNQLENLAIFKTTADHMRYHRSDIPVEAFTGVNRKWEMIVNEKYSRPT